jgi:biofilm PGA synthesis lipoprotein PgaB
MNIIYFLFSMLLSIHASAADSFISLCYHDITSSITGNAYSIRRQEIIEQFEYLKANNYQSISIDDILAVKKNKKSLPEKAILLTVDDGLESFYHVLFPLLKQYQFKAVLAIVGKWTDDGYTKNYEPFGNKEARMASWKQLKEMSDSGLVEIISHSYDLHRGEVFNPQGNEAPAAGYFKYFPESNSYESDVAFRSRIQSDLARSVRDLERNIGKKSKAMAWPYGSFNKISQEVAEANGMSLHLTIEEGVNKIANLQYVKRSMIMAGTKIDDFAWLLKRNTQPEKPLRSIRIKLDEIYSVNQKTMATNVDALIEQIRFLGVNTAFLETYSTADGAAYFPNGSMKVRADLLSRVSHVLLTRTKVESLYLVLPKNLQENNSSYVSALVRNSHATGVLVQDDAAVSIPQIRDALNKYRPMFKIAVRTNINHDLVDLRVIESLSDIRSQKLNENILIQFVEADHKKLEAKVNAAAEFGLSNIGYFPASLSLSNPDNRFLRSIFSSASDPFESLERSFR